MASVVIKHSIIIRNFRSVRHSRTTCKTNKTYFINRKFSFREVKPITGDCKAKQFRPEATTFYNKRCTIRELGGVTESHVGSDLSCSK